MKLDNIDIDKLKLADIPKFNKCLCELCDDGCFEKSGQEHHPQCRHHPPQRTQLPAATRCPLSHYQQTFLPLTSLSDGTDHRRQPCPAAPDNDIPISFKNVPMSKISSTQEHYPPPPSGITKQKPVPAAKQTDNLIVAKNSGPMETQTHYKTEYIEKPILPYALRSAKEPVRESQVQITDPSAAISSKTTSHSHFKSWQPVSTQPYTEMPSIAGYVLFPDADRSFDTTSGRTFVSYPNISPPKPIFRPEYDGSLKVSGGTMDLRTNYRQHYVTPKLSATRSAPVKNPNDSHEPKVYTRRPMNGISQTSFDFQPYSNHRPPLPVDFEPFQSQITIGDSSSPLTNDTQYRLDYPGYDARKHPRQVAVAPKNQTYAPPVEKMDSLTVTQRDFQPLDISALPRIQAYPQKATLSVKDQTGPMESITMSRYHYQPYGRVGTSRRYGEVAPNFYIPPTEKFQGTTTTADAFQGRAAKPARAYIPEIRTISRKGKHDHNTSYRLDYHPHGLSLCAAKAYTIAQKKEANPTSISTQ